MANTRPKTHDHAVYVDETSRDILKQHFGSMVLSARPFDGRIDDVQTSYVFFRTKAQAHQYAIFVLTVLCGIGLGKAPIVTVD